MISEGYIEHNGKKISYSQLNNSFLITTDSLLLSNFINIKQKDKLIVDIGTGQALIPLLLSTRTKSKIYGIEIQKELAIVAKKNIYANSLENQIKIINDKVQNYKTYFTEHNIDIVISNPPYFKTEANSKINDSFTKTISRHELELTFEELAFCSSKLLKQNGHFYFVHRVERLIEIIEILKKYKLEPKRIKFIYSKNNKNSVLFLLESVFCGKEGLKVEPPIFLER